MSDRLMWLMILAYTVIVAASLWDRQYGRAVYFAGAIVISVGVLMMRGDG